MTFYPPPLGILPSAHYASVHLSSVHPLPPPRASGTHNVSKCLRVGTKKEGICSVPVNITFQHLCSIFLNSSLNKTFNCPVSPVVACMEKGWGERWALLLELTDALPFPKYWLAKTMLSLTGREVFVNYHRTTGHICQYLRSQRNFAYKNRVWVISFLKAVNSSSFDRCTWPEIFKPICLS